MKQPGKLLQLLLILLVAAVADVHGECEARDSVVVADAAVASESCHGGDHADDESFVVTPLGPNIGAQVFGLNLSTISEAQFQRLEAALLQHHVLFFRDHPISPAEQRDVARRFAKLHIHPVYPTAEGVPEIVVLDSHDDIPPDNDNWHTDVTFSPTPPMGAVLAAKVIPPSGGDTLWCSGFAAFEALSEPIQKLLMGLEAEHDFRKSFPESRHLQPPEMYEKWKLAVAKNPPLLHPAVRTHPVTGRLALFVNEGFTTRIPSLRPTESDALLRLLFEHVRKPEFQVRWRWQQDDLAIWDNRGTQHYATLGYFPHRRIMHRAAMTGDRPYFRAEATTTTTAAAAAAAE